MISMNPHDVAGYSLRKIMSGVIPQAAQQYGVAMYTNDQQIAASFKYVFHDGIYFIAIDKFSRQYYARLMSGFLRLSLELSIVLRGLLLEQRSPAWDFGVDVATVCR